jgi:hypothetical protein
MNEAERKGQETGRLSRKKLARYVEEHRVTVVRASDGGVYVMERHATLLGCWRVAVKRAPVTVETRLGSHRMSPRKFWRLMSRHHLTHLYDQFGAGPHDPLYLPADIRGLSDDPYRSLAWLAQRAEAFGKSKVAYYEYAWAQLLRRHHILSPHGRPQLRRALAPSASAARPPPAACPAISAPTRR